LAIGPFGRPLRILSTKDRPELGNIGVIGRTRCGKGLYATAQLLTWEHSAIVNDIKGDMYRETAGARANMGHKIFVFDTRGVGNTYDPFRNRNTEDELLAVARHMLLEPYEGEGSVFTKRGIKMLTQLFKAAKLEGKPPVAYAGHLLHRGPVFCAEQLQEVSTKHNLPPEENLATRFLDVAIADVNYGDRFFQSCWSTLDKIEPIITKTVIKSLSGSDFSARDLLLGERPVTLYLRWPELHVQALSPLIRLVCCSLFDDLITIYDEQKEHGRQHRCWKVLALLSEAARAPIAGLPEYMATLAGRHISVWAEYQSRSQPETIYGPSRAETLWGNLEAQIYYRPAVGDIKTAEFLQHRLGNTSGFSRSHTIHGAHATEGESEQRIPVLDAWSAHRLKDDQAIGLYADTPPFLVNRMDFRKFPELVKRSKIPPPPVFPLPDPPPIQELRKYGEVGFYDIVKGSSETVKPST
jgi:type IV secretion system protein VirD4